MPINLYIVNISEHFQVISIKEREGNGKINERIREKVYSVLRGRKWREIIYLLY